MAYPPAASYEEALALICEREEEIESLDALLILLERATSDNGERHSLVDGAEELDVGDLL